jgi:hypothetical protein
MAARSWVQRSRRDTNPMRFLIPATRPDRFRGYATRVVRTTVRDATYVLGRRSGRSRRERLGGQVAASADKRLEQLPATSTSA